MAHESIVGDQSLQPPNKDTGETVAVVPLRQGSAKIRVRTSPRLRHKAAVPQPEAEVPRSEPFDLTDSGSISYTLIGTHSAIGNWIPVRKMS
jgi:hypothetical protein